MTESFEASRYEPATRPYQKRFDYEYRRHAFEKLRALDLPLRDVQELLDASGEIIYEAQAGLLAHKELVLLVEWTSPLHVVIVVDETRAEERVVTVYEPDPSDWTADFRRRRR